MAHGDNELLRICFRQRNSFMEWVGNVSSEKWIATFEKELLSKFSGGVLNKSLTLFMEDDTSWDTAQKDKECETKRTFENFN